MTASDLLERLLERGISLSATADGRLRLTGGSEAALTPQLRGEVQAQRAELLTLLTTPNEKGVRLSSRPAGAERPPAQPPLPASATTVVGPPVKPGPPAESEVEIERPMSTGSKWVLALGIVGFIGLLEVAGRGAAPAPSPDLAGPGVVLGQPWPWPNTPGW